MEKKETKVSEINVDTFRKHGKDSGSLEVQVALLTSRIRQLTGHAQVNPKDHASKRGMVKMVARRRKSLQYLQRTNPDSYKVLIERLELKK